MFCFPTNVEARCWCVVVIIFLNNGSKRVKGNKSRREKYVKVCGVRFLRASVFMRVGRFHARVSTQSIIIIIIIIILVVSFHPHKQPRRDETRAYLDLLFHRHHIFYRFFSVSFKRGLSFSPPTSPPRKKTAFVKPVQFFPPKKRILCLGCKICKDFFFPFFFGEMNVRFGGGCIVHKTKNVSVKK